MEESEAKRRYEAAGMQTPWDALPINQKRMIGVVFDKSDRERSAAALMKMAASKSVESSLGWAHPDCETLQEAARILRGEPEPKPDEHAPGVLS